MSTLPSSIDVAIVGAGAAGVAAATRLTKAGVAAVMIEARDRVGGRAHTIPAAGDVIDLACDWLHSADKNVLVKVAEEHGFTVDKGTPGWSGPASVGLPSRDHADYRKAMEQFFDAVEEAAETGRDRPASDLLPRNSRWTMLLRAVATYYSGTELEHISIIDFDRYEDTRINWTIREGYGAMIAGAAKGLPVVFDCAVSRIDHSGKTVKLETQRGTIEAKAAIVLRDEHETGDRALLNLGHTFGHALEAWTGYSDRLLHGEGVAIGMAQAFRFSEGRKLCPAGTAARVEAHLKAVGLPTRVAQIPGGKADAAELVRLMGQDKKVRDGRLTFILARDIGQAFITRDVEASEVRAFLEQDLALPG
jgi:hypothetical protein